MTWCTWGCISVSSCVQSSLSVAGQSKTHQWGSWSAESVVKALLRGEEERRNVHSALSLVECEAGLLHSPRSHFTHLKSYFTHPLTTCSQLSLCYLSHWGICFFVLPGWCVDIKRNQSSHQVTHILVMFRWWVTIWWQVDEWVSEVPGDPVSKWMSERGMLGQDFKPLHEYSWPLHWKIPT